MVYVEHILTRKFEQNKIIFKKISKQALKNFYSENKCFHVKVDIMYLFVVTKSEQRN